MPGYRETQEISQRLTELVRARALRALRRKDQDLGEVYERIAEGVRRDLAADGYSPKRVREILHAHFGDTFEERRRIIEESIRESAVEGGKLDRELYESVYGEDAQAPRPLARCSRQTRKRSRLRLLASAGGSQLTA